MACHTSLCLFAAMEDDAEQATAAAVSFEADFESAQECLRSGDPEGAAELLEPLLQARYTPHTPIARHCLQR